MLNTFKNVMIKSAIIGITCFGQSIVLTMHESHKSNYFSQFNVRFLMRFGARDLTVLNSIHGHTIDRPTVLLKNACGLCKKTTTKQNKTNKQTNKQKHEI